MIGKLELAWENFIGKRNFIKYKFQRRILRFLPLTPANGSRSQKKSKIEGVEGKGK